MPNYENVQNNLFLAAKNHIAQSIILHSMRFHVLHETYLPAEFGVFIALRLGGDVFTSLTKKKKKNRKIKMILAHSPF